MIDFSCRCYHKDRTPIVKDLYIQDYAEALLADYRPGLLKTPGKIDAFHFLENYLGVTVEFQDIFYPEGKVPVAGATIFNDEAIMVFDRSGMKVSSIDVPAGTVLIDTVNHARVDNDCTITFVFRDGTEVKAKIKNGVRQYRKRANKETSNE